MGASRWGKARVVRGTGLDTCILYLACLPVCEESPTAGLRLRTGYLVGCTALLSCHLDSVNQQFERRDGL